MLKKPCYYYLYISIFKIDSASVSDDGGEPPQVGHVLGGHEHDHCVRTGRTQTVLSS